MTVRGGIWMCAWLLRLLGLLSLLVTSPLMAEDDPVNESPVKVNVSGANDEVLADNLKAFLPSLRNLKCDSPEERVERFIDASQSKLTEGAEAVGYFSASFKMTSARTSNCWVLNIAVEPGLPVRVAESNIRVSGDGESLPAFRKVAANLPYTSGEVLVTQKYEDFKANLTHAASRLGFFDAKFEEREVRVNVDTREAVINLHFVTGSRYQVGTINVEQDVLDDKHLNRYVRLVPGQPYDSEQILKQQRVLEASGYYSDVQISSRFQEAENSQVPVAINATRRKRYTYSANIGYATDTDIRIEGGMEAHWVNNKGHSLDTKLRLSQKDPGVVLNYKVPLWNPEHEYASLSTGWNKSDNDDIKSEALNLELNYNRLNSNNWKQTAFVNFVDEKTQVNSDPSTRTQLTLLGARVSKTKSDDALKPTEGWRLQAQVQGAYQGVLSDQSLLQGDVNAKYLYTFENKDKMLLRGELGTTFIDDLSAMPKSLRFFTGGQTSVRGYDFESLGEMDDEGNVIGGKHLLVSSIEYEHPVADKISAAIFVDAGSAFDQWNDYAVSIGAGIGARYQSPLGPIRVDFAVPKEDSSDIHFYFSLGPDL